MAYKCYREHIHADGSRPRRVIFTVCVVVVALAASGLGALWPLSSARADEAKTSGSHGNCIALTQKGTNQVHLSAEAVSENLNSEFLQIDFAEIAFWGYSLETCDREFVPSINAEILGFGRFLVSTGHTCGYWIQPLGLDGKIHKSSYQVCNSLLTRASSLGAKLKLSLSTADTSTTLPSTRLIRLARPPDVA